MIAFVALFFAMLFWGTSFAITKEAVENLDPIFVMFVRLAVASLFFILWSPLWDWKKIRSSLNPGDKILIVFLVLSEPCLYFLCETYALKFTTASAAGVITGLFPLTIAAGAWVFFQIKSSVMFWLGCLLAVAGVTFLTIVSHAHEVAPKPVIGNTLMLCAVALGTAYTLLASKLSSRINPIFLTALQAWGGAIFYLILCFIPVGRIDGLAYSDVVSFGHWPDGVTQKEMVRLVYLGIFVSAGSYGLYIFAVSQLSPTTIAILINFIPILAVVFAVYYLGESLSLLQVLAIVTVLIGIFVASSSKRKTSGHG